MPTLTWKAVSYLVPIAAEIFSRINANVLIKNIRKNLAKCMLDSQVKTYSICSTFPSCKKLQTS